MKLTEEIKRKRQAGYDDYMKEFETGEVVAPPPDTDEWWHGYWRAFYENPLTKYRYAINKKFQAATAARAEETWNYLLNYIPRNPPTWDKLTEDQRRRITECLEEQAFMIAGAMNL